MHGPLNVKFDHEILGNLWQEFEYRFDIVLASLNAHR